MNEEDLVLFFEAYDKAISNEERPFEEQDAFVMDLSRFLAAQCTRRAGKTNGLARRFYQTMRKYPNSLSRYIALTRDSAKDIMWPVLEEMNEKYNWQAKFSEHNLTMTIPNGAMLKLFGADMKNFIRRLKGAKSPAVAIDEAQEFGPHIIELVNDVLVPTIIDYDDSWLALTGTPGPIPKGLFYDITELGKGDFSVHKWSLYNNPYLPNAQQFVTDLKKRNQWDDNHPTYLREYQNRWVIDEDALLIKYNDKRNHYDLLPNQVWVYVLGIDIGFKDSDALAVLAWCGSDPNIYLVEESITANQDITSLVEEINRLSKLYDISKMVIDTGGLGKKIAEEIIRRHQIPVIAADKSRKFENVSLLNDFLRQSRFKAKRTSRFATDSFQVQLDYERTTPDKLVVKKGLHSDIIDAVLYAFKESPAYTYQTPKVAPKYQSQEWYKEEAERMEQEAEEHFQAQQDQTKGYGDWSF